MRHPPRPCQMSKTAADRIIEYHRPRASSSAMIT
jgi:hypothetical protein